MKNKKIPKKFTDFEKKYHAMQDEIDELKIKLAKKEYEEVASTALDSLWDDIITFLKDWELYEKDKRRKMPPDSVQFLNQMSTKYTVSFKINPKLLGLKFMQLGRWIDDSGNIHVFTNNGFKNTEKKIG